MTQSLQCIPENPLVTFCDTPKKFFGTYPFKVMVRSQRTRKSCSLRAGLSYLNLVGQARSHGNEIVFFKRAEDAAALIEYLSQRVIPKVRFPAPIEVYGPRNTAVVNRLAEIDPVKVRVVNTLPYHARYRVDVNLWALLDTTFLFEDTDTITQVTQALAEFKPRIESQSFLDNRGANRRIPYRWYVPDHPNLRTAVMMLSFLEHVEVTKYETYNEIAENKIDK
jgi:hypothetical protein